MCTRVGVLDRGRLVVQEELRDAAGADRRAPSWSRPTATGSSACSTAASRSATGDRLVVRADDPADLNRLLVDGGVRVARARPGAPRPRAGRARGDHATASPGGGVRVIRVELRQAAPPAAHLGHDRCCSTRCRRWWRCCWRSPTSARGPVRGRRSCPRCSPTARCSRWPRWRSCCRCSCRSPSRSSPATRSRARRRAARCATCWPGRSAARRLLVAKLVSVLAFVLLAVVVVAAVGYVVGRLLLGGGDASGLVTGVSGQQPDLDAARRAHADVDRLRRRCRCSASRRWRCCSPRSPTPPLGAALGALAFLIASTLLLTLDAAAALQPYLPTRYWLSFVDLFRDPILWRDLVRGVGAAGRLRRWCSSARPGPTSPPRTSPAERPAGSAADAGAVPRGRRCPARCRARPAPPGRPGRSPCAVSAARAHRLHGEVQRARRAGPSRAGTTTSSAVDHTETNTGPGRGLVAGVEPAQQVAVRRELPAGRRAAGRRAPAPSSASVVPCCGDPS